MRGGKEHNDRRKKRDSCAAASAPAGHQEDGLENIAFNVRLLTRENHGLIDRQILYFHISDIASMGNGNFTGFRLMRFLLVNY